METTRPSNILVTGGAGFVGTHLLTHLVREAVGLHIVSLDAQVPSRPLPGVAYHACDLTHRDETLCLIREIAPTRVIHLAGLTTGNDPARYFAANVTAAQCLLDACGSLLAPPCVILVGSAAEYGGMEQGVHKVNEDRPLRGDTPYALTKRIQEELGLMYARTCGIPVVFVRPFNICGPGQASSLVPAAFMEQALAVMQGRANTIEVGNLASSRDFVDVRDVARAIWSLALIGDQVAEKAFNIASGNSIRIQDLLDQVIALIDPNLTYRQDPSRLKQVDVSSIVGGIEQINEATGWQPTYTIQQSLRDMWQAILERERAKA